MNGEEKVQEAKIAVIQELGTYSNLNHAQTNTAQDRINNAQTLAEVAQAKQTAQDLNNAMGQLQQSIDNYQDVEQSVDYTDADTSKQSAYTNAVHQAQNTLDKDLGHDLTQSEVEQAIENVNHAKQELNGEEKVSEAKINALQTLDNDTHLNQHQREAAKNNINGATTLSQVAQAIDQANALNTVMGQLKDSISDQATIKQQINYTDADTDRKTNYDDAVTNAQAILDPVNGNNLSKEQVESAINQVNTTKDQLNGNTNLQNAKNEANTQLNALDHINHAQSDNLRDQIATAPSVEAVHQIEATAQALDQAMQQLQQAIANRNDILNSQNYADASPDKKQAYDQALQNADDILAKTTGPNSDQQAVEQAMQAVTNAAHELNGAQNLHDAQSQATQAIENAPHLNEQQKNELKGKVNQAQTVAAVTDLQNNANALNTAMKQLKQAIADHDTIVADGNYTNASPQEQGAYTDAYQRAQNLINGTPDVIINPADITTATQNVNNAEQGLNGNSNLANAKQEATNALQQMTGLSDAQRQSIQDQIDTAKQLPDIDTIKANAGNLNNAMSDLRQEVAKQHDVKASQPYVDANTSNQDDYNHAITNAESMINETTQPTLNPKAVTQALNQIKTSTQDLNGVENLNNAKQSATNDLQHLSHLNQAQQADLTQQLKDAPNVASVEQVKAKATSLDQAMEQLINAVNDKDQVHQSVNYSDADQPKQSAYDHAINDAQLITDPTTGSNSTQAEVEVALSAINTAKQDLNGNRKVEDAKNNANQALNNLNHLNNAQRENIEHQIDQAQTLADIDRINNDAQALNNAMGQLADSLNDKAETLNSQNYNDASPDKKTDYTDAVSNAETILNPTQGGNLTKDEVEAAINAVNSKKDALNGKENLANAKQNANQAIDGLTHLTNPQKEALKQLVDQSTTVAEVKDNENKAQAVDTAMEHLNQSVADNTDIKNGQNYIDSSENNKDAYNNAVNTAQGIQNEVTNPVIDPTVINQAADTVTNTKDGLNGNENLTHAKEEAMQSVGTYDHLNNAQQKDIENRIKQAISVDEANQIKIEAENLNHAMNDLNQAIKDKDDIKSNVNYTDADPAKQEAYNNAISNAEHILSKTNGNNATQTEVAEAIQAVKRAKDTLNGNDNVQNAKIQATDTINNSNDLNHAQKDALKQQVADATTVADVNAIKQNALDLNQAMTALKQGIANKDQILADGNYTNASPDKQHAYNDAVNHAQQLIDGVPNVIVSPSDIQNALNHVNQANNDLNGNANLINAKQQVTQALDQLPNLNQAQRDEFNKQINQALQVPDVNAIQQAAEKLNDAMTALKQGIANKDDIKGSENYHDADPDRQTAFDDAINHADTLLNEQNNPTMDPDTIKQALANVNEANHNLNGDQKLATAQQDAKTTLGTLDHLNQAQIDALTQQIDQAPDIAATNKIKQNAESLNNAMNQLDQALQTKADTLGSINYSDADQPKKDAYNDAVTLAESIVDHNSQNNASQDDIAQALKQLNDAKDALNGNSNVENAKQEAIEQINNAQDLNPAQKEALKQQVNLANTVNDVNQVKATTSNLDQAMSALKQGIADKDQTIADGNYTNANPDKQQAYSEAINHAEQIINGTPNAIVDPQAITNALHQVDQTKGDLNGNDNLHDAQQNASTLIDGLPNLNPAQKAALKEQVNQTSLVPSVDQIKQSANDLNTAMGNLNQTLQANAQVPQTIDYTQANNDKQTAYDNAVAQAQQVVNGNQVVQLSPDAVKQMTDAINHAKDDLNGDENLAQAKQDAKANLNTLPDLNQPQHDALTNQIEQAQTIEAVNQVKQQAQNVNDAMHNLKQGIANKDDILCSENYHDADTDKQTAYQDAIRQAESIINQTVDPTLNPDDITQALTQVNLAKDDLNGDTKLTTEKQNATNDVNGMTHLNDAQKQALTSQIEHAPNIDAVNTAKQTAESLNNAMDQLEQAIHNKNQILADGNYLNADQAIQDAYNQAVGNAENVLNPQLGTNEDQSTIEAMTNKVNQAIQNLNGNSNLAQAKQDANQALTQLPHLNDAQRHDLETQIANAPLVTDVDSIKQNAQTLDQAMEHLRDSVKDNQQTLNSEDYHDATADRQNDYNNAVNDANQIINATTPVMNPTDINAAANLVNANKVALDGDENLTHAKQQATQTIDHLDHLNQAQIQQAQEGIAQATDIDAVTQHVRDAQALDNAMNQLQNAIANQNDVKQQSQFVNADPDKQSAYTDAVAHAQSIIDHQHGPNASQPEVEQALTQVQQALQNLNGEQRLQDSKLHAQQAIDGLADLNDPQKSALKEQVNHAPLITDVQQIEQQADSLNQAMHGLRQSIDDNAEVKASSAYINEDPTEQQNYDQAVQNAQDLINEQQATLDTNVINQTTESVNNSKQALQGVTKLQNEKDLAKERINQLPHLNDAQKHMEDALIDNETTRTAVKNDVTEAQQLDQYMDALQQSIADKQTTLDSSQYINADPNKKQDYDNAIQNAESIIAGITNPTINKDNVNQATESVNATKQALNGVEKLAEDKQHAGETMNQFNQLTPAQQQALNDAITDAQTRDEVAQKVAQAEALNNAMQALKDSIKDHQQVENSSQFTNEDPKQKDDYSQAVQHALDIINQATNPTLDQTQIEQATQAVINAKDQLHGDQKLAQDKQLANETINHLQNLNAAQRQALQEQINQVPTRDEVAQKVAQAEALDQSMKALRDAIQDHQQVENSSPFINEDSPEQNAYTNAVQQAEALINQVDHPTLDRTQVQQLTEAVTNAKDHLHGAEKLQNDKQHAITDLNQLNGLNDAQRNTFETQINQAPTRNEVAEIVARANALNQAMNTLRNVIQDQPQIESSSPFINEDSPEQEAYKQAVSNAKSIVDKTTDPIMDKDHVDQAIQEVNDAIANLHGNQKLAQAQQQALTDLDGLSNLNHDQLEFAKDAVNQATTRNEVAQIVQSANQLDQTMGRLKDVMNQANRDKSDPNYTEASTEKQDAFNQSLTNATHITDIQTGPNATQIDVENAITSLQQAINNLDGNARVTNAKVQTIQDIEQQPHLNDEQKSAMKDQVKQATTLKSIAQIEDQSHQLDHSTDQLQQAIDEHNHVTNTVDFTQADPDKQAAYNQAIAQAQQLLTQNATQQEVEQAITAIENAKHDLNGDEKVAEAKANATQNIDQLTALNEAQHQAINNRINNANDLNDIQSIVNEANKLNHAMTELQQAVNDNNEPTKQTGNYLNADTQLKHDFDEAITQAQQALDHPTGSNLTTDQINQLKDAITHTKDALNGNQRLNDSKSDALNKLDQLTHLNNAQKQMAEQQINSANTLGDVAKAAQKATTLDKSMDALNQYVQRTEAPVKASSNYIDADDELKANYNATLDRAHNVLNKAQGNALTNDEVESLQQEIINAENALNGDQNVSKAKGKADQFIDSLENLNPNQRNLAHQLVAQADDLDTLNDIINNQIDLNDAMKVLKDIVNNDVPSSENSIKYQNADDNAKANFTQAKDDAIKLLKGTDNEVGDTNDIQGAIQTLKEVINHLNGDSRLQDAKNKAIQMINKALADKINDIEATNATDQDKIDAKNKAEALANQTINNINKATTNQAVDNVENNGSQAIAQIHANEIPKAQNDAKQDINQHSQALIDAIDHNSNLSDAEKDALKA
ncbi:DUF1542 domain-containing protein [Staphylococcus warneri]|uniref:DUF1542 domain-containing protein n=1 Tax=Staphylococcus warneri TaxID=1292 RepID=UPI003BF5DBE6